MKWVTNSGILRVKLSIEEHKQLLQSLPKQETLKFSDHSMIYRAERTNNVVVCVRGNVYVFVENWQ